MKITNDSLVELAYKILGDDGEVFETSDEAEPLTYVHGEGELPPALEKALDGREEGDELEVAFAPGEAFGEYNPEGIVTVPRSEFSEEVNAEPGEWITVTVEGEDDKSEELEMRVVEASPDAVVLDANHPLADTAVTFQVKVLRVREDV